VRGVHAETKIDRKDFGIGWNEVLDNGGVPVGREVGLDPNVEIVEKAAAPTAAKAKKWRPPATREPPTDTLTGRAIRETASRKGPPNAHGDNCRPRPSLPCARGWRPRSLGSP
jgi:hypothetical protein